MKQSNESGTQISRTSQHKVQARNGGVALRTGTDHVMLVAWMRTYVEKNVDDVIVRMTPDQARDAAKLLAEYAEFVERMNVAMHCAKCGSTEHMTEQCVLTSGFAGPAEADLVSIADGGPCNQMVKRTVKPKSKTRARKAELQQRAVLRAIENGCDTVNAIVESTQYSAAIVRKVAAQLAADGKITAKKCRRFDHQQHRDGWGYSLFGGAGMCQRKFWQYSPVKSA